MSAEQRMSVIEKIEQLERSKSELQPPIFDSRKDIVIDKRSQTTGPDGQFNKTQRTNSIKVIKTQTEGVNKRALSGADEHFAGVGRRGDSGADEEASVGEQVSINITVQSKDRRKSPVVGIELKMESESVEIVPINEMGPAKNNVITPENDNIVLENGERSPTEKNKTASFKKEVIASGGEFSIRDLEKDKENITEESGEISQEPINDDNAKKEEDDEIEYKPPQPMTEEEEMAILEKFSDADPKHLQTCLSFYRSMDKERYGYITIQHFCYAVKTIRPYMKDREIVEIFVDLDTNHDGLVSFNEFLTEMMKPRIKNEQELMNVFDGMDKDKDGFLSASDLKNSAEEHGIILTDFDTEDILRHGHQEKNKLTFKEFCRCSRK